jgi:hypothetical protein
MKARVLGLFTRGTLARCRPSASACKSGSDIDRKQVWTRREKIPVFRSDAIRRASVNPYDGKDEEQSATTINTTNVVQLRSAAAETCYRLRIVGGTQALAVN